MTYFHQAFIPSNRILHSPLLGHKIKQKTLPLKFFTVIVRAGNTIRQTRQLPRAQSWRERPKNGLLSFLNEHFHSVIFGGYLSFAYRLISPC